MGSTGASNRLQVAGWVFDGHRQWKGQSFGRFSWLNRPCRVYCHLPVSLLHIPWTPKSQNHQIWPPPLFATVIAMQYRGLSGLIMPRVASACALLSDEFKTKLFGIFSLYFSSFKLGMALKQKLETASQPIIWFYRILEWSRIWNIHWS